MIVVQDPEGEYAQGQMVVLGRATSTLRITEIPEILVVVILVAVTGIPEILEAPMLLWIRRLASSTATLSNVQCRSREDLRRCRSG